MNSRSKDRSTGTQRSPLRLVCAAPENSRYVAKPGSNQAWGHLFPKDTSTPWRNWSKCKWVCDRAIRVALFRNIDKPSRYAVLHPSTKPQGKDGVFDDRPEAYSEETGRRLRVVSSNSVRTSTGWQFSFFDDMGAMGDSWAESPQEALDSVFAGRHPAQDARRWRLEQVVDAHGKKFGTRKES